MLDSSINSRLKAFRHRPFHPEGPAQTYIDKKLDIGEDRFN